MADIDYLSKKGLNRYDNKVKNYIGIELTKAEYDQLSEEEKNKGTYWITDYSGSGGGSNIELDKTLSIEGKAADAKAVGDAITVRYNSEGYLEVLVDGVWEQIEVNADTSGSVLFNAEKGNVANFVLYNGATNNQTNNYFGGQLTLDVGDTLVYKGTWTDYWACGCIISDPIDLTNYTKLIFNYSATATIAANYTLMNAFVVTTKQQSMTSVAHKVILSPSTTGQSGIGEIDLTNITGYQYIGFEMSCGNGTVTFELTEAHLE